jgi:hypothetical protein
MHGPIVEFAFNSVSKFQIEFSVRKALHGLAIYGTSTDADGVTPDTGTGDDQLIREEQEHTENVEGDTTNHLHMDRE